MDAYKIWEFRKNCANEVTPERKIYGQNSKFWQFFGGGLYSQISAPINVKFRMGSHGA